MSAIRNDISLTARVKGPRSAGRSASEDACGIDRDMRGRFRPRRHASALPPRCRPTTPRDVAATARSAADRARTLESPAMTYVPAADRYERMRYRRCGRSGLKLPEISLGLWQNFGEERPLEHAKAIVRRAFDLGITHFDLANN